jgi:hypothetical protein
MSVESWLTSQSWPGEGYGKNIPSQSSALSTHGVNMVGRVEWAEGRSVGREGQVRVGLLSQGGG